MNIFFLSLNPKECAKMYCDQHVNKILLEIVQMLYTAWHVYGLPDDWDPPLTLKGAKGYKKAHENHPMCIWVRSSENAYRFTTLLGMSLAIEYTRRFKRCHACSSHILWLHEHVPAGPFVCERSLTAYYGQYGVPQCMPDEHKQYDLIEAYKSYYTTKTFARWT